MSMSLFLKSFFKLLLLISVVLLTSCESLQFYHQAAVGQSKLMMKRRSTVELIQASETDPALRYRLELADEVLAFADSHGLPANGAYSSYVETGESYVIWNVFAAEPYQLLLKTHCFPIAGCVSYRGFFNVEDAQRYAGKLQAEGFDVFVGGVRAYSTLGWFNDPLLDTFLFIPEEQLAALLFHELAHQVTYAPGDTRYNESLATAIELHLLELWLADRKESDRFDRHLVMAERRKQVLALIDATREELRTLYGSDLSQSDMAVEKETLIERMKLNYAALSRDWSEPKPYEYWMKGTINNARLETVADYHGWVPAMTAYIDEHGLDNFRVELTRLTGLSYEERTAVLESWQ